MTFEKTKNVLILGLTQLPNYYLVHVLHESTWNWIVAQLFFVSLLSF